MNSKLDSEKFADLQRVIKRSSESADVLRKSLSSLNNTKKTHRSHTYLFGQLKRSAYSIYGLTSLLEGFATNTFLKYPIGVILRAEALDVVIGLLLLEYCQNKKYDEAEALMNKLDIVLVRRAFNEIQKDRAEGKITQEVFKQRQLWLINEYPWAFDDKKVLKKGFRQFNIHDYSTAIEMSNFVNELKRAVHCYYNLSMYEHFSSFAINRYNHQFTDWDFAIIDQSLMLACLKSYLISQELNVQSELTEQLQKTILETV